MNDLCDCHAEGAKQPRLYITHAILSVSQQLVGFFVFNETVMLIERLEKNTDETLLAQAG